MLDTNILLDWLFDRDPVRTKQITKLMAHSKVLHIPDIVVIELAFALAKTYHLSRTMIELNLAKVIDEPTFNCNRLLFRPALVDYDEHPSLSLVDCCLLRYAELQNCLPVWTSDKKLVNQSSGRARLLK